MPGATAERRLVCRCEFRLLRVTALTALAVLALAGAASAASSKALIVGAKAHLSAGDRTLVVAGRTPRCEFGSSVAIKVRVRQAGRFARGSWRARCVGPRLAWHVRLRPKLGRFKAGRAKVVVISTVSKKGKIVAKRRVSRRVRLKVGRGSPLRDYRINAGITITAPPGITVLIQGGGRGEMGSLCTSDETVTRVTPEGGTQRIVVGFNAKDGGSCAVENSFSNFLVRLEGLGRMEKSWFWVGQYGGVFESRDYLASCFSGDARDVEISRLNYWRISGMGCTKTDRFELKIDVP